MISRYFKSLDLLKALQDFPLSSFFAILATTCAISYIDYNDQDFLIKVCGSGYLAFLAAISAETHRKITRNHWVLIIPFIVLIGWYLYLPVDIDDVPRYLEYRYAYRSLGMALILHLIIAIIPYIKTSSEEDFWEYNKHLFLRIFEAFLFSLIIFIGLALAILAIDKLFGIEVDGEWYARLFVFLIGIFNSLYFLSKFPEIDYDGKVENPANAYRVLSQYILIPISFIYLILLYAYTVKIILEGQLPQGWIGYLTLCFSVVGILTWLLNYFNPNFSDNKITKLYVNHFFKLLTIPVIMLFVAIGVRLQEYGITENRYIVATLASWLGLLCFGYGWIKKPHIKYIPISFAILTALSIFGGPIDMFGVSLKNQINRLQELLIEREILRNGSFDLAAIESLDNTAKYDLKSLISTVGDRSDLSIIDEWSEDSFFENYDESKDYNRANFAHKKLNISQVYSPPNEATNYFNLSTDRNGQIDIEGFSSMANYQIANNKNQSENTIILKDDHMITQDGYHEISLEQLVLDKFGEQNRAIPIDQMTVSFQNEADTSKFIIEYLHGKIENGQVIIEGGQGWLLTKK